MYWLTWMLMTTTMRMMTKVVKPDLFRPLRRRRLIARRRPQLQNSFVTNRTLIQSLVFMAFGAGLSAHAGIMTDRKRSSARLHPMGDRFRE